MPVRLVRPVRLVVAGMAAAALVATVGPGPAALGAAPAPPTPAGPTPAAPQPTDVAGACPPDEGLAIDGSIREDLAAADGHSARSAAAGSSFGVGCSPVPEGDLGSGGAGIPSPPDVDPNADNWNDPFDRQNGLYLGYQFGADEGPLDYWEQPIALSAVNAAKVGGKWPGGVVYGIVVTSSLGAQEQVNATLPPYDGCQWNGPVQATRIPGQVASWAPGGRQVYRYDHVPMRIGARKFARAPGQWFHYLCGPATPAHVTGPPAGSRLSPLEASYYLTPHWVYALGLSGPDLDRAAPAMRAARAQVQARVVTSPGPPAFRGVVNLKTWMWTDARRYDIDLPGGRAVVEPTGIRVVAPGVPLKAHDLRQGGCRTGGKPDVGDAAADTDCYFTFTEANRGPGDFYTVGFAVRWQVTVAGVGRPLTFWTTTTENYSVGEVQVPAGGG